MRHPVELMWYMSEVLARRDDLFLQRDVLLV